MEVKKSLATPRTTVFDIFLSHAFEDAEIIAGVKVTLQQEGLSVYVDWDDDAQLDRSKVTSATADLLRDRMNHCHFLLFVSSVASPKSKWMPWGIGYFDGRHAGHVGILPIFEDLSEIFAGQEYLGLYPAYKEINFTEYGRRIGRDIDSKTGRRLESDAKY